MRLPIACALLPAVLGIASLLTFAQSTQQAPDGPRPFSLTIVALQDIVKAGSPVSIKVTKKNISNHDLTPPLISALNPGFDINVRDEKGNPAPKSEWVRKQIQSEWQRSSGSVMGGVLKPGDTDWQIITVNQYYNLSRPGKYSIQVQRAEQTDRKNVVVKSNTITVTVSP